MMLETHSLLSASQRPCPVTDVIVVLGVSSGIDIDSDFDREPMSPTYSEKVTKLFL
jgi:hypothetical protein